MIREARLRAEFAALYPGVDPDTWYTAATLAEHLLGRIVRGGGEIPAAPRVLDPEHFEFRGESTSGAGEGARMPVGSEADSSAEVILRRAPHH
jgi:hypothetical protein